MIFLPGTDKQSKILFKTLPEKFSSTLILGSGCEEIAKTMSEEYSSNVTIIVDNYDSLLQSRLKLAGQKNISVKMMDFSNTDFRDSSFDLAYAQASISNNNRNKIIKEIKRLLTPEGYFCNGEIVNLKDQAPAFVNDIWKASNISPLNSTYLAGFYMDKGFVIILEEDISGSLKDFYSISSQLLKEKSGDLTEEEKSYYKKLLKQINHESNAYLKLGGDRYIGFKMLIMKKGQV